MSSPTHSPDINQLTETQLLTRLNSLRESTSVPVTIDLERRCISIEGGMNWSVERMVNELVGRLVSSFGFSVSISSH